MVLGKSLGKCTGMYNMNSTSSTPFCTSALKTFMLPFEPTHPIVHMPRWNKWEDGIPETSGLENGPNLWERKNEILSWQDLHFFSALRTSPRSWAISKKTIVILFQQYHYGIVNVSDGKCRPQPARLKVCPEYLVLQKEEFIFPDDDDTYPRDNKVSQNNPALSIKVTLALEASLGVALITI